MTARLNNTAVFSPRDRSADSPAGQGLTLYRSSRDSVDLPTTGAHCIAPRPPATIAKTAQRSTNPSTLSVAPNYSAPASEPITPPSSLLTACPATVPKSNESCPHYVGIGGSLRLA
jgi:hypothetical protein